MRFRLRTLLIWAAIGPPMLAGFWWLGRAILEVPNLLAGIVLVLCFSVGLAGVLSWIANALIHSASHPDNRK